VFLPYIAVVLANAHRTTQLTSAEPFVAPERPAIGTHPVVVPPADQDPAEARKIDTEK
jgi:hypothetical protein